MLVTSIRRSAHWVYSLLFEGSVGLQLLIQVMSTCVMIRILRLITFYVTNVR